MQMETNRKPGCQYLYHTKQILKQNKQKEDKEGHCMMINGSVKPEDKIL